MLPGCATVVLETVLAIQAFAGSLSSPPEQEVVAGLQAAYKAVAALTAWADTVILGESVTGDQVEKVVEPVRCAVIVLVNCIAARVGPGGLGRGSSLPDITSDLPDEPGLALSQSSDSILDLALQKPPLLPRVSGPPDPAPPLPPKLARPRFDRSFEDLLAQSYSLQSRALDWPQGVNTPRSSQSRSRAQRLIDRTLPSPHGLDTTLPDLELVSASRESLTETDGMSRPPPLHLSPFSWSQSSRDRSNTSSPSLETLSLTSHLSEDPPAVPRKSRLSTPDPTRPFPNRKMSQYDNLPESEAHSLRRSYDTEGCPRLHIPRSDSFPVSPHTTWAKVSLPTNKLVLKTPLPTPLPPLYCNISFVFFNLDSGCTSKATGVRDAATASPKEEEHHVLHGDVWQVRLAERGRLVAGIFVGVNFFLNGSCPRAFSTRTTCCTMCGSKTSMSTPSMRPHPYLTSP